MKTLLKLIALVPVLFATTACTLPLRTQTQLADEGQCGTCQHLAKANPPVVEKIGGRVYDPNRSCHREYRYIPGPGGKTSQYIKECVCY